MHRASLYTIYIIRDETKRKKFMKAIYSTLYAKCTIAFLFIIHNQSAKKGGEPVPTLTMCKIRWHKSEWAVSNDQRQFGRRSNFVNFVFLYGRKVSTGHKYQCQLFTLESFKEKNHQCPATSPPPTHILQDWHLSKSRCHQIYPLLHHHQNNAGFLKPVLKTFRSHLTRSLREGNSTSTLAKRFWLEKDLHCWMKGKFWRKGWLTIQN